MAAESTPLPRVIVKFHDATDLPYADDIGGEIDRLGDPLWSRLAQRFGGIRIRRLNQRLDPQAINVLVARAVARDHAYKRRNLLTYYIVDCPPGVDPFAVEEALNGWNMVEVAYVARQPTSPIDLEYQNPPVVSPPSGGVNAVSVQSVGGRGGNQKLIDIEVGWNLNHEALAHLGLVTPMSGEFDASEISHGTSVLGIVCGKAPVTTATLPRFAGIAPDASVGITSYRENGLNDETLIPVRITEALQTLTVGHVLLLEIEISGLPIEIRPACFDWIRLASALGVIVIEPAGNNKVNLDTHLVGGRAILLRSTSNPDYQESGAIVVSAGSNKHAGSLPLTGLGAVAFGNFGSRIDCWACGDGNAFTSISSGAGDLTTYGGFGGTSAAAAIIAGATLSVQGMRESASKPRLGPGEMRAILSDANNGTAALGTLSSLLGRMPDLALIQSSINDLPDLYMRDYVGDPGDPNGGAFSASPDIIVRNEPLAPGTTSDDAFGDGSGTENDDLLSQAVVTGQPNYVYVRLRNRGATAAADVDVDVYFAPPASLISPADWTLLGATRVAAVPVGNVLTVTAPIKWEASAIPGPGHYCLVAIAGNSVDPSPPVRPVGASTSSLVINSWDNFQRLIGDNNNIAWRNLFVVSPDPPEGSSSAGVGLNFRMAGALDVPRPMALEIVAQLPEGAAISLEAATDIVKALGLRRSSEVNHGAERGNTIVALNPHGRFVIAPHPLSPGQHVPMTLHVFIPPQFRISGYTVYARQLHAGREVGRVTWRLQRPPQTRGLMNWLRRRLGMR